jgi:pimeloyl-ACP methyl ester carboxylesterase
MQYCAGVAAQGRPSTAMISDSDWRQLYPFTSRWMPLHGWRCHYVDEGSGRPVLLVHGNPSWSFFWRELIVALRADYRVVAIDHIGCGLSDKPPQKAYPYTLARRIEDLRRFIEELDLHQITLVAHDWGGAIGMGAAAAFPERFHALVLANTAAFRATTCPWRIRLCRVPLLNRLAIQGLNLFARAALKMAVCQPQRMTAAVRAGLLAPYDSWRNRVAIRRFVEDIPLKPSHPSYRTLVEVESSLAAFANHPVCLIWAMRDWCFTPHFLERFLQYFPQAEVHRLADAGHYVMEDQPQHVLSIVRGFLQRTAK